MKKLPKGLYALLPFKKGLFSIIRFFGKPPARIYRHLHFKGVFTVKADTQSAFRIRHYGFQIENEIFWAGLEGGWEKESFRIWIALCRDASVILDIGANTGVYALIAKAVNPGCKAYAFEPVKRVYEKLQENIRLNGYDITAVEKAVSDHDGAAVIYDTDDEHNLSVTVNKKTAAGATIEVEIETVRIDSFIREQNIGRIDLVKIDVETHEPEVLAGFGEYLALFRPSLLVEVLSDETGQKINAQVAGLGYLFFNIDERGSCRQVERIVKSDCFNYLLCSEAVAAKLGLIKP